MTTAIALAKNAETPSVRAFVEKAKAMPYLTAEQEKKAAHLFATHADIKARDLLVDSHLRQVIRGAMKWAKYGFSADDLIQEGNIGLLKAVEKFDVNKGFRLTTYAEWWIKAYMQEYMLTNRSSIRIPNTNKNKNILALLNKAKAALSGSNATIAAVYKKIAKTVDCDVDTVRMLHTLSSGTKSFSDPIKEEGGGDTFGDLIPDTAPLPEEIVVESDERFSRRTMLTRAVATLTEREATVFRFRRMVDADDIKTLEDLAGEFNVTRERIRQIEVRAFEKVQAFVHKEQLALRGEQLARISADKEQRSKAAAKMIVPTVIVPKKIAAPQKNPGWHVVTREGERQLVFCP